MKDRDSFLLYHSFYEPVKEMTLEEKGMLFDAIYEYQISGVIPELTPALKVAFLYMKSQFERDSKKYERVCNRNRENGLKGGRKRNNPEEPKKPSGLFGNPKEPKKADTDTDTDTDTDKEESIKKKNRRFSPPSLLEIQNYFSELSIKRGLKINTTHEAEKYEAFYTSKGWFVGKNKMVDWKAAVRNWIKNVKPTNGHSFETLTQEKSLM
ncbi:MAG: hypothetical protein GXY59_03190 [Bacteroidales bacterium]|nr:hypothetical protein [Bacteroidales bacterium]